MLMKPIDKVLLVVLVILGLYFIVFHRDPLPLNHEAIGLGELHLVHDIIGAILIGAAVFLWWRSRRPAQASAPT